MKIRTTFEREPNSRFVNNYFDVSLKAWQSKYGQKACF